MTLQQLTYFRELARNRDRSLTGTAKALYISQPTLSYSISSLEKELGVPLFLRENQRLSLTRNGETFLCRVDDILGRLDEAVAEVRAMGKTVSASKIVVGCISGLTDMFLSGFLREYYSRGRGESAELVLIHRQEGELTRMLEQGKVDLALCGEAKHTTLDCCPLYSEEILLYVPEGHPLACRDSVEARELNGLRLVKLFPDNPVQVLVNLILNSRGVVYQTSTEQENFDDAAAFVANGFGAGFLPAIPATDRYGLRGIQVADVSIAQTVYLAWRKDNPFQSSLGGLRDFLVDYGGTWGQSTKKSYPSAASIKGVQN